MDTPTTTHIYACNVTLHALDTPVELSLSSGPWVLLVPKDSHVCLPSGWRVLLAPENMLMCLVIPATFFYLRSNSFKKIFLSLLCACVSATPVM